MEEEYDEEVDCLVSKHMGRMPTPSKPGLSTHLGGFPKCRGLRSLGLLVLGGLLAVCLEHGLGLVGCWSSVEKNDPKSKDPPPTSVDVVSFDLATFVKLSEQAEAGPRMMKMDIEGSEYQVLQKMLSMDLLCSGMLDNMTIEWHRWFFSNTTQPTLADFDALVERVTRRRAQPGCTPTHIVELDDESYFDDGRPLPEVSEESKRHFLRTPSTYAPSTNGDDPRMSADLFKGCSSIYYDVGANVGAHIRKLFEPEKYPNATMLRSFDAIFGPAWQRRQHFNASGLCAFGFEANPEWASTLQNIETVYNANGWRVKFFVPALVSDVGGKTTRLFINPDPAHNDWAASAVKHWGG